MFSNWTENQVAQRIALSKMVTQTKAKTLFEGIKSKAAVTKDNASGNKDKNKTFEASQG